MTPSSSLARMQRVISLWVLACAAGWSLAWWSHAPVVAVVGGLTILFSHVWMLGIEFLLLGRVARHDPAPTATARELWGAWVAESVQAARVFGWRQPYRWRAEPDCLEGDRVKGRHGVVLVHGFVCNRGFWTPWLRRLRPTGRAFVAVNLEPVFTRIDHYVPSLEAAVEQVRRATGLPPVLVCHSMGGLVARAWLRTRPDPEAVAHVVTLGSPHAGTWLARWSHLPNGRQMRQDSDWLADLQRAWTPALGARFTCWYSNADNIVMPPSTATLPGADNRLVRGAAHVELAFRPQVMDDCLHLISTLR